MMMMIWPMTCQRLRQCWRSWRTVTRSGRESGQCRVRTVVAAASAANFESVLGFELNVEVDDEHDDDSFLAIEVVAVAVPGQRPFHFRSCSYASAGRHFCKAPGSPRQCCSEAVESGCEQTAAVLPTAACGRSCCAGGGSELPPQGRVAPAAAASASPARLRSTQRSCPEAEGDAEGKDVD